MSTIGLLVIGGVLFLIGVMVTLTNLENGKRRQRMPARDVRRAGRGARAHSHEQVGAAAHQQAPRRFIAGVVVTGIGVLLGLGGVVAGIVDELG